eukprot:scaffold100125_cov50-Phaeocystis_antarctica.AAC.1
MLILVGRCATGIDALSQRLASCARASTQLKFSGGKRKSCRAGGSWGLLGKRSLQAVGGAASTP